MNLIKICSPSSTFSKFIYVSKEVYKGVAIVLSILTVVINAFVLITTKGVEEYIIMLAILDIALLFAIICCIHIYMHREMPFVQLTDDSIIFEDTAIRYNEIVSIFRVAERFGSGKYRSTHYYFKINGVTQTLKSEITNFTAEEWSEIIGCCIYMNPSIKIDEIAMQI